MAIETLCFTEILRTNVESGSSRWQFSAVTPEYASSCKICKCNIKSSPQEWKQLTKEHLGMEAPQGFPEQLPPFMPNALVKGEYLSSYAKKFSEQPVDANC